MGQRKSMILVLKNLGAWEVMKSNEACYSCDYNESRLKTAWAAIQVEESLFSKLLNALSYLQMVRRRSHSYALVELIVL